MFEDAGLKEREIGQAVLEQYGISLAEIEFLPIGYDSATWVYRLSAEGGGRYFLKLRARGGFRPPSLTVPAYLRGIGVPHILAPLFATSGSTWVEIDNFALILYPFIEGRPGADGGLSDGQWRSFGAAARQIHDSQLPQEIRQTLPGEEYAPHRSFLVDVLNKAASGPQTDDIKDEFAQFWQERRGDIREALNRALALGERLRRMGLPVVLCHGDMHTWNILVDGRQRIWLVDWDETVLAHKERDLMFVVGGIGGDGVGEQTAAWFLDGYGDAAINPTALAYYRCAWAVQDIVEFGDLVRSDQRGEATRQKALHGFKRLFEPGNMVDIALRSAEELG